VKNPYMEDFSHGNLCRERHKFALDRQEKLHSQISLAVP